MRSRELPPFDNEIDYLNPTASGQADSVRHADAVHRAVGLPDNPLLRVPIADRPTPEQLRKYVINNTLVYIGGGDGTANEVIAAAIGHVPNDPETSTRNFLTHSNIVRSILVVAGSDGNGNNLSASTLGIYGRHPQLLKHARDLQVGMHRPGLFEVLDEHNEPVRTGIVTTGIGIGATPSVAARLEDKRQQLRGQGRLQRLRRELAIATKEMLDLPPFTATVTVGKDDPTTKKFTAITGYELIGSRVYAKGGRTNVNVDDTRFQPETVSYHKRMADRLASVATLGIRMRGNIHGAEPIDLRDTQLSFKLTSDTPIPFHIDGNVGPEYDLLPGQTIRLQLARLAVPILMRG
jgi:diacylglycerol kinase family enzyme